MNASIYVPTATRRTLTNRPEIHLMPDEMPSYVLAVFQDLSIVRLLYQLLDVVFAKVTLSHRIGIQDEIDRFCFTHSY
uniref:Uncharacterized protein n=1 Tax=Anopheles dirus TaxID=7168 RepID=A0A182NYL2_9DIPT